MHLSEDFLFLSDTDLKGLGLTTGAISDAIETAIWEQAQGRVHTSPKAAILPGGGRYMMSTLAVGDAAGLTVLKTATVSPENPARGLPAINGAILALDSETGLLRAVLGANWVTAIRTAALSLVAARRLADPAASEIAFIGSGVQAHSHLAAFAEEYPLTGIRVSGRGKANIEKLCEKAREMGLKAVAAESPQEALEGADLIVSSVTLDYEIAPFLDANWLKPTAFAAITDLGIPWHDAGMEAFGAIVIDDHIQEKASEKPLAPAHLVRADLAELVLDNATMPGAAGKPAGFAFRGLAIGDFAATALAVEHAVMKQAGRCIAP